MNNILKKIKEYKVQIAVGIALGVIVAMILGVIYSNQVKEDISVNGITYPYSQPIGELNINLKSNVVDIPESLPIFMVDGSNTQILTDILYKLLDSRYEIDLSKDFYLDKGKDLFSYSITSRIFVIYSESGFSTWFKLTSQEDISSFFEEYFNIDGIKINNTKKQNNGTLYEGMYTVKGLEIGSVFLRGYSFSVLVDSNGEILELSTLLIYDHQLKELQSLPLISLDLLVENPLYPRLVLHENIEERYYNQDRLLYITAELRELNATQVELKNIYNDADYGYILPTYSIYGEGRIENNRNDKFWSEDRKSVV